MAAIRTRLTNAMAISAFGSQVQGTAGSQSDLDVAGSLADDVLINKSATVERCVSRARQEYEYDPANFVTDFTRQDAAILNVQRACEAVLDMGQHIVRREGLGVPQHCGARLPKHRSAHLGQCHHRPLGCVLGVYAHGVETRLGLPPATCRISPVAPNLLESPYIPTNGSPKMSSLNSLGTTAPATSKIHMIGGEKGGVGKSMVSRLLAQYFIDKDIPFVGFDTDRSHGALLRFYSDYASPVLIDRFEALDHIVEAAVELPGVRVLVDLAAQTHEPLVRWIEDSGVLNMADDTGFTLHYWHVMDSGRDSVDLLTRLLDRYGKQLNYVLVLNQLRGDDFSQLQRSGQLERALGLGSKVISIKHLSDAVVQKIDANNSSFWAAKTDTSGGDASLRLMDRQRLSMWLQHAFEELAKAEA